MEKRPRLRALSVCSGIEAASVAWDGLIDVHAVSEIEPFPSAVLAHHYPDVPNLGDFTRWREWPAELLRDSDVLVGGTPCQAFSVAGRRQSLADERGNLTLLFLELAHAIDDLRRAAGRPPLWILWENVPGTFSVSDNAFGCFVGALCGSDAALPRPEGRGWTDAGVVSGPERSAAWRILDAQFFGLAQRRRRLFVVARGGPRAWDSADALLPIVESRGWHPEPRRGAREDVTGGAPAGAGGGGGPAPDGRRRVVGALTSAGGHAVPGNTLQDVVAGYLVPEIAWALQERDAKGPDSSTKEGHLIVEPIAFDTTQLTHPENRSNPQPGGPCHPLAAGAHAPAVASGVSVRRLTPRECERLQGFPDDYTRIPYRGKAAGKCPDGPRYRALGNSMAVPVMRYLGERIVATDGNEREGA